MNTLREENISASAFNMVLMFKAESNIRRAHDMVMEYIMHTDCSMQDADYVVEQACNNGLLSDYDMYVVHGLMGVPYEEETDFSIDF